MGSKEQVRKGKEWERKVAAMFREAGIEAKRILDQPRDSGGDVDADPFFVECKHGASPPSSLATLEQAAASCPDGRFPVAVIKRNRCKPVVSMYAEDFFEIVEFLAAMGWGRKEGT